MKLEKFVSLSWRWIFHKELSSKLTFINCPYWSLSLSTFVSIEICPYWHLSLLTFVPIDICPYWHLSLLTFLPVNICPHWCLSLLMDVHISICPDWSWGDADVILVELAPGLLSVSRAYRCGSARHRCIWGCGSILLELVPLTSENSRGSLVSPWARWSSGIVPVFLDREGS